MWETYHTKNIIRKRVFEIRYNVCMDDLLKKIQNPYTTFLMKSLLLGTPPDIPLILLLFSF